MFTIRSRNGPHPLVRAVALAYDAAMEVLRSGKKEVVKFVTPSGVTGVVDTSISDAALNQFARSLRAKIQRTAAKVARQGAKAK